MRQVVRIGGKCTVVSELDWRVHFSVWSWKIQISDSNTLFNYVIGCFCCLLTSTLLVRRIFPVKIAAAQCKDWFQINYRASDEHDGYAVFRIWQPPLKSSALLRAICTRQWAKMHSAKHLPSLTLIKRDSAGLLHAEANLTSYFFSGHWQRPWPSVKNMPSAKKVEWKGTDNSGATCRRCVA